MVKWSVTPEPRVPALTFEALRLVRFAPEPAKLAAWMPVGVMVEMFAPEPMKIEVEALIPACPVGAANEEPEPKLTAPLSVPPARGR